MKDVVPERDLRARSGLERPGLGVDEEPLQRESPRGPTEAHGHGRRCERQRAAGRQSSR